MIHCTAAGFWPFFWRLIWGCRCFCGFSSLGRPRLFYFLGALSSARAATDRSATLDGSACSPSVIAHTLEAAAETPSPSATRPARATIARALPEGISAAAAAATTSAARLTVRALASAARHGAHAFECECHCEICSERESRGSCE